MQGCSHHEMAAESLHVRQNLSARPDWTDKWQAGKGVREPVPVWNQGSECAPGCACIICVASCQQRPLARLHGRTHLCRPCTGGLGWPCPGKAGRPPRGTCPASRLGQGCRPQEKMAGRMGDRTRYPASLHRQGPLQSCPAWGHRRCAEAHARAGSWSNCPVRLRLPPVVDWRRRGRNAGRWKRDERFGRPRCRMKRDPWQWLAAAVLLRLSSA